MIVALYILVALVAVGVVLKLTDRPQPREEAQSPAIVPQECCGQHAVCERDSLLAAMQQEAEYFDDEELDDYRGRSPQAYSPAETEQWREVLMTLRPDEVARWARSIQLRGLELPEQLRDELILLVEESRHDRTAAI